MIVRLIVPLAVLLAVASLSPFAQSPPSGAPEAAAPPQLPPRDRVTPTAIGQSVLRGRVTQLDNGQPLRQVLISLTSSSLPQTLPTTLTDNEGRFELAGLLAATYTITASKGGFVTFQYGQRHPYQPGRPVAVAAAAVVERLDFALMPAAAITGRILDEDGDPAPNITMRVFRERYVEGRPLMSATVAPLDTTDDRGEFRIYGIPPGTYFLAATRQMRSPDDRSPLNLRSRPSADMTTSYYPGAWSPEAAQRITLASGQVAGLSFALLPAPTARLTVLVRTADGQPLTRTSSQSVSVSLTTSVAGDGSISPSTWSDGAFFWDNMPPGEYGVSATIRARDASESARGRRGAGADPAQAAERTRRFLGTEAAAARVTLAGVDARVELIPQKVAVARGRITFDATASFAALRPEQIRVRAASVDPLDEIVGVEIAAPTNANWTFETTIAQGRRLLRPLLPAGWAVQRITLGDADVTDTPLNFGSRDIDGITILLTDRLTEVSGVVRNSNGRAVDDATVVLFAEDSGKWGYPSRFVAAVRADERGRFSHRGLPAARYLAVALDYLESGEETNPELLRRLQPLGARFELADRDATTVDLTLSALR